MNLGDGLLFEFENGKPRLIFTSQGADKHPNKLLSRPRAVAVLSSRQPCCVEETQREEQARPQAGRRCRDPRRKGGAAGGAGASSTVKSDTHLLTSCNASKSWTNHTAEGGAKAVPRVRSAKGPDRPSNTDSSSTANGKAALKNSTVTLSNGKTGIKNSTVTLTNGKTATKNSTVTLTTEKPELKDTTVTLTNGEPVLRERMVCLTNEQLQQILSNIQTSNVPEKQSQGNRPDSVQHPLEDRTGGGGGEKSTSYISSAGPTGSSQERDERSSGLLSWLTDGERDRQTVLDARRAQWRRELDEQLLLKQQKAQDTSDTVREETCSVLSVQSSIREQPAAIRSSFRLGEATPAEEALSAERREEQRRHWLEELDIQREEAIRRRREEKQLHNQTEDHERWAMHFDSLLRKPLVLAPAPAQGPPAPTQGPPAPAQGPPAPAQATVAPDRGEWEVGRGPSSSLSLAWDNCSWDSLSRASMDTTVTTRASYLRSMTALLDPAQIEERERRRIKQMELQRGIEAQVEERRQQREREEERRREEERKTERRVEMERETLQLQHQLDRQRERDKEEQVSRKKEGLYQSVQRAQEEALRSKQQQRISELAKKGHDVSKLLQSMDIHARSRAGQSCEEVGAAERREEEEERSAISPRRDMAVQTDMSPSLPDRNCIQTPDISAVYQPPAPRPAAPPAPHNAKRRTGKENICLTEPGGGGGGRGGGGGGGDPYEQFARTERGKDKRRPQWNTQRPSRQFIPASERYPAGLQRHRQECRRRRQAELLALQEKNCQSRTDPAPPASPPQYQLEADLSPNPNPDPGQGRVKASPSGKVESGSRGMIVSPAVQTDRGRSPPVPAVRHRLQSQQPVSLSRPPSHYSLPSQPSPQGGAQGTSSPPLQMEFVPYRRTEEIYRLDPLEPLSASHRHTEAPQPGSASSPPPPPPAAHSQADRDPLLHPELLRNSHRQQEILRGLAQLRQGLLQKQKELETGLNPLLKLHDNGLHDNGLHDNGLRSPPATQPM